MTATREPVDDGPHLDRPCPNCGAGPGEPCVTTTGQAMPALTHRGRPRPRKRRDPALATTGSRWDPSEATFQAELFKLARAEGWWANHTRRAKAGDGQWVTPTTVRGMPDCEFWHPARGESFRAELKVKGRRVTERQAAVIESMRAAGIEVHVWTPSDWPAIEARLRGRLL